VIGAQLGWNADFIQANRPAANLSPAFVARHQQRHREALRQRNRARLAARLRRLMQRLFGRQL